MCTDGRVTFPGCRSLSAGPAALDWLHLVWQVGLAVTAVTARKLLKLKRQSLKHVSKLSLKQVNLRVRLSHQTSRNRKMRVDNHGSIHQRIRLPKKEKKELPADADIYCMKCNSVFDSTQELSDHEKNCYTGRRYPCVTVTVAGQRGNRFRSKE